MSIPFQFARTVYVPLALAICLCHSPVRAVTIADSVSEWSTTGTQGENDWYNGYYNLTLDPDMTYAPGDFQPFLNDGSGVIGPDGANQWNGTGYALYREGGGPWTSLGQDNGHPNGTNSAPNEEHWVIRRWVSDYAGQVAITSNLAAQNVNGPGTSVQLFQNGTLLDTVYNSSGANLANTVYPTISVGDVLDLALTPVSIDGDRGDGSDGSLFSLRITDDPIPPPVVPPLADSVIDWSTTGTQGENNWFNGLYNLTTDSDGIYQTDDFVPFTNSAGPTGGPVSPDGNHWSEGGTWDLTPSGAPWTFIGQEGLHPNGTNSAPNEEQWAVRRWVADLDAETPVEVTWKMAKSNVSGDGVTGLLFVNGEQVDAATIAGNDGVGVERTYSFSAKAGDIIDLALTPEGLTDRADGSDGSLNRLTIRVVPEPTGLTLVAIAGCGVLGFRRKRR